MTGGKVCAVHLAAMVVGFSWLACENGDASSSSSSSSASREESDELSRARGDSQGSNLTRGKSGPLESNETETETETELGSATGDPEGTDTGTGDTSSSIATSTGSESGCLLAGECVLIGGTQGCCSHDQDFDAVCFEMNHKGYKCK